jgi:hypothetical protein
MTPWPSSAVVKRTPVLVVLICTVISFGLDRPCWYLIRCEALNAIYAREQLGPRVSLCALVMISL